MKKLICLIFSAVIVLSLCVLPAAAYTDDDGAGNLVETGYDTDTEISAEGDYMCLLTDTLSLSGTAGGDVIAACMSFRSSSLTAGGSVRIAAMEAVIGAECRNITAAAMELEITGDTDCSAVYAAADKVTFRGECESLYVSASVVYVYGTVTGIAEIDADTVCFDSSCSVASAKVTSPSAPKMTDGTAAADNAALSGVLVWNDSSATVRDYIFAAAISIISALIGAMLLQLTIGQKIYDAAYDVFRRPLRCILIGLLALIAVPTAAMMLITVSTEVGMALLCIYCAAVLTALIFTGCFIGVKLFPSMNRYLASVIGATMIAVAVNIPYVKFIVSILASSAALGFWCSTAFRRRLPPSPVTEDPDFSAPSVDSQNL